MSHTRWIAAGLLAVAPCLGWAQEAHHHTMHMSAPMAAGPQAHGVSAHGCWIRQLPGDLPSGGFLVIENQNDQPAVLVGVHAKAYGQAMMHRTETQADMSRMLMADEITVPAHGKLAFAPGGYHVMLEQPQAALQPGDHTDLTFALKDHTQLTVRCEVKPADATQ